MDTNKELTKISQGHYIYKGFHIECLGYYPPEGRVVWEATDEHGCGFAHDFTLKGVVKLIDEELDNDSPPNES